MCGKGDAALLVRCGRRFVGYGDSVLERENLRAWRTTGSIRKEDMYWLIRGQKVEVDQVEKAVIVGSDMYV